MRKFDILIKYKSIYNINLTHFVNKVLKLILMEEERIKMDSKA
jgi:hypothetical protein